jgi:hypothetical protein
MTMANPPMGSAQKSANFTTEIGRAFCSTGEATLNARELLSSIHH